jgi:outer membrane protein assembly factor BamD
MQNATSCGCCLVETMDNALPSLTGRIRVSLPPHTNCNPGFNGMWHFLRALLLIATLLGAGCINLKEETDETKNWSAKRLYQEAKAALRLDQYHLAVGYLEKLEARYPYGQYAAQAQLDVAYAYYRGNEPTLALAAAERFIRLHPTHPFVDYAYYLKGLIHFDVKRRIFDRLLGANVDYSDRDPETMRKAVNAFRDLVKRFPDSRYAPDANQRLTYLVDLMAKSEIHIARHYYKYEAYVATVNRCKYVLENFQNTASTEDALGIMSMAYLKMGYTTLMRDAERVLKLNFPNSHYLRKLSAMRMRSNSESG